MRLPLLAMFPKIRFCSSNKFSLWRQTHTISWNHDLHVSSALYHSFCLFQLVSELGPNYGLKAREYQEGGITTCFWIWTSHQHVHQSPAFAADWSIDLLKAVWRQMISMFLPFSVECRNALTITTTRINILLWGNSYHTTGKSCTPQETGIYAPIPCRVRYLPTPTHGTEGTFLSHHTDSNCTVPKEILDGASWSLAFEHLYP